MSFGIVSGTRKPAILYEVGLGHKSTLVFDLCFLISRKDIRISCEHKASQDKKTNRAGDGHGHFLSDWRKLPAAGELACVSPGLPTHGRGSGHFRPGWSP